VTESHSARLGEAWDWGPVVLSWRDAREGGVNPEDGRNVVFHEFAHKLDMQDGRADGYPRLRTEEDYRRWFEVMKREWDTLVAGGRATILDDYGAESAVELFAVATEAFFERPIQLRERHLDLYRVLSEYYRQDPADRVEALDCDE
jgi:Mlc titration factor MtfA (ptsG expression regulator)